VVRSLAQVARSAVSRALRPARRLLAERRHRELDRVHARELAALRARVDWDAFRTLRARYPQVGTEHKGPLKYFDADSYLARDLSRALELGLHHGAPRRVLDLGCGFGYFLLSCAHLGHHAQGVDFAEENHPESSCYGEMIALLGQRRVLHRIEPFVALPDLGPPFDLVTAYDICFTRKPDGTVWGVPEWESCLRDLAVRLRPGGALHLEFNLRTDGPGFQTPALADFFRDAGARLSRTGRVVHFAPGRLRIP
jgi:SAM-dependent methyltransferase